MESSRRINEVNKTTKMVAFSDIHMEFDNLILPFGDILVFAGDATTQGTENEVMYFLSWLQSQKTRYRAIIFIGGNHDRLLEQDPSLFRQLKEEYAPDTIYLESSSYVDPISKLKFFGLPYCQYINGRWCFERSEAEMEEIVKSIPKDTDILISHGPPFGILDNFYRNREVIDPTARFGFRYEKTELRVGGKALLKKIKELKIPRIIFGHIHENGSKSLEKDGTVCYNVSILDQHYEIAHEPMVINV